MSDEELKTAASDKKTNPFFRPSALSSAANKIWNSASNVEKSSTVVSGDLIPSMSSFQTKPGLTKENSELMPKAFVFGNAINDRVEKKSELTPVKTFGSLATSNNDDRHMNGGGAPSGEAGVASTSKLAESAAQLEEERKKLQVSTKEQEIATGEENETLLCKIQCKLYQYNSSTKTWCERGNGTLNVDENLQGDSPDETRLVMRASGTLRLLLNSRILPQTTVERISAKRVKLSAIDYETKELTLYLVSTAESSAGLLYKAIQGCVNRMKKDSNSSEETRKRTLTDEKNILEMSTKKRKSNELASGGDLT